MLSSIARVGANELQFVRQRVASLKHCGPTSCDSTTLGAATCEPKNLWVARLEVVDLRGWDNLSRF